MVVVFFSWLPPLYFLFDSCNVTHIWNLSRYFWCHFLYIIPYINIKALFIPQTQRSHQDTDIKKSQLGRLLLLKPFALWKRGLEEAQNILPTPWLLLTQIYPSAKQTLLRYVCLLLIADILCMFQHPLTPYQGMVFTIYSGDTWKCTRPPIKWIPLSTRSFLHPNFLQAPEFPATPLPGQTLSPFSRLTPGPVSTFSWATTSS